MLGFDCTLSGGCKLQGNINQMLEGPFDFGTWSALKADNRNISSFSQAYLPTTDANKFVDRWLQFSSPAILLNPMPPHI